MSERLARTVGSGEERVDREETRGLAAPARGPLSPAMLAAGNQAVVRMLAVARHPGTEGLKDPHAASAHAGEKDRREHDQQAQDDFDRKSSAEMETELRKLATKGAGSYVIDIARLPPALQALIRQIQQTITEVENAIGKEGVDLRALRDRMKTGARSWHDDDTGKIPLSKAEPSPLSSFFATWRSDDAEGGGRDTTRKQEKKGFTGAKRPLREYTAVGWLTGHQDGRLIYDALEDAFYLSVKHYTDEMYFRIVAPRAQVAPAAITLWDFDFLLFQAWEGLAAELNRMATAAAADEAPAAPERSAIRFDALSEDTQRYMVELSRVRALYADAYRAARAMLAAAEEKRAKDALIAARLAKHSQQRKRGKAAEETATEQAELPEQFAQFTWKGLTFYVGSKAGYIGYRSSKGIACPPYKAGTTIGDLGTLFRTCVDETPPGDMESIALALAALAAEPTRHPTAALEALFAVVRRSPFEQSRRAFGVALPMATGGTIATGGVPVQVLLQEAALGREIVVALLKERWGVEKEEVESTLLREAGRNATRAVGVLRNWLFAALVPDEHRRTRLPPKPATPAPAPSEGKQPAAPEAEKPPEEAKPPPEAEKAPEEGKPPPPESAPPEEIVVTLPEPSIGAKAIERPRSRWAQMASSIQGLPIRDGVVAPEDVLIELVLSHEYEGFTNFWDAYDQFMAEHHGELAFELSPVQVVNRLSRESPTRLYIMRPTDWPIYDEFRKNNPQFSYPW